MPSRSPPTTPSSDINHPHLVYYRPLSKSQPSIVTVPDSPTCLDKNVQTTPRRKTPPNPATNCCSTNPSQSTNDSPKKRSPWSTNTLTIKRSTTEQKPLYPYDRPLQSTQPCPQPIQILPVYHGTWGPPPTQRIKTPTQSGLIHTLYQLNTLPFLQTLERAPRDHGRRTFCGACYHLGHYKKDCPFYQCPHCLLTQPCCNEDQCLDNPIYSGPTAIKQESPSPPPLQVPPLKTVKKPHFPPNCQNSNSSSLSKSSNRINKRGWKGKKPEWK